MFGSSHYSKPHLPSSWWAKTTHLPALQKQPTRSQIARCNGENLTPLQLAWLFQILASNNEVFKGGQGQYTGAPVASDSRTMLFLFKPILIKFQWRIKISWRTKSDNNAQLEPFFISLQNNLKIRKGPSQHLTHQRKTEPFDLLSTSVKSTVISFGGSVHSSQLKGSYPPWKASFTPQVWI